MKTSENPLGAQLTAVITVCGCICLHLPALLPLSLSPSFVSLVDSGNEQKSPFDRACLEFQYPLAKFITLRKKAPCSFSQAVFGSIYPPCLSSQQKVSIYFTHNKFLLQFKLRQAKYGDMH